MAWTYSAWRSQATDQLKLDMLRLHIQELEDAVSSEKASDAMSEQYTAITARLAALEKREEELTKSVESQGGMVSRIRLDKYS